MKKGRANLSKVQPGGLLSRIELPMETVVVPAGGLSVGMQIVGTDGKREKGRKDIVETPPYFRTDKDMEQGTVCIMTRNPDDHRQKKSLRVNRWTKFTIELYKV